MPSNQYDDKIASRAGVEGVMRRCCEETLRVLREHKESLLTIIEVFIHDPLFRWGLTPLGAQQRQKDDADVADGEVPLEPHSPMEDGLLNADAERALLRIKQKLDGLEGGVSLLIILCTWAAGTSYQAHQTLLPDDSGRVSGDGCRVHGALDIFAWIVPIRANALCVIAGEGEARGVEGQVQQLFQDAQDPEILAKAFVGWGCLGLIAVVCVTGVTR